MNAELKPINEQVLVITGASSGIGLATARAASARGARLVLLARSGHALREIAAALDADGGRALAVPCDVTDRGKLEAAADAAIERFGRIDTWVNNAGVAIYGRLEQFEDRDNRRLFDTDFWGVCYGSLAALPHLKRSRGALINVGSEVSEAVAPLLGMYSAAKHAVKGFTDALRLEVQELDGAPVSITLIEPTAVNTPFPQHARNQMEQEPRLPDPMIEPGDVADAILAAATHPMRSKKVGGRSSLNAAMAKIVPSLADRMAAQQSRNMIRDEPPRRPEGILFISSEELGVVGRTHGEPGK